MRAVLLHRTSNLPAWLLLLPHLVLACSDDSGLRGSTTDSGDAAAGDAIADGSDSPQDIEGARDPDGSLLADGTDTTEDSDAAPLDLPATVTVLMGLGEREAAAGCYFVGELQSDATGCSIVRLQWSVERAGLIDEEVAIVAPNEGEGVWQPSVRADGEAIAFTYRTRREVAIRVTEGEDGGFGTAVAELTGPIWTFPNFGAEGRLTVSRPDDGPYCERSAECWEIPNWNESQWVTPGSGDEPSRLNPHGFSLQDTYGHPTRPEIVAGHGKFVSSALEHYPVCGGAEPDTPCDLHASPLPIVMNTETGQTWVLSLESVEAPYGSVSSPLACIIHEAFVPV
jgi:hypothetical protein